MTAIISTEKSSFNPNLLLGIPDDNIKITMYVKNKFVFIGSAQKDIHVWKLVETPIMATQVLTHSAGHSCHYFAWWLKTSGKTFINWWEFFNAI